MGSSGYLEGERRRLDSREADAESEEIVPRGNQDETTEDGLVPSSSTISILHNRISAQDTVERDASVDLRPVERTSRVSLDRNSTSPQYIPGFGEDGDDV